MLPDGDVSEGVLEAVQMRNGDAAMGMNSEFSGSSPGPIVGVGS
jgi:hypothetical protein